MNEHYTSAADVERAMGCLVLAVVAGIGIVAFAAIGKGAGWW